MKKDKRERRKRNKRKRERREKRKKDQYSGEEMKKSNSFLFRVVFYILL